MDIVSPEKRSWMMSRVQNRNTAPEKAVRSVIHRLGYRFSLHNRTLPGNPDIVLTRHKKVVFVHGCFWHQHDGCSSAKKPKTNQEFWNTKLDENVRRDKSVQYLLGQLGWKCLVVWECDLANHDRLVGTLKKFLHVT